MTERFLRHVKVILNHEGGYVNDPVDPGGETKYGISKKAHPDLNISALTKDQAIDIYYREYYLPVKVENLLDDTAALHLFDHAVTSGPGRAVKLLQKAIGMPQTGNMSQDTIRNANQRTDLSVLLSHARKNFYESLGSAKFLKGWLHRVTDIDLKKKA